MIDIGKETFFFKKKSLKVHDKHVDKCEIDLDLQIVKYFNNYLTN